MIDSYNKLPIGLYLDICAVNEDPALDELTKQVRTLAALSGKTEAEILNQPIADYKRMVATASFLTREAEGVGRPASEYKVGGWTLVPVRDYRKLTAAQYLDYQQLYPEREKHVVELLSVGLVPKGHKYGDGYDIAEVQGVIRDNLSVADTLALAAFFFKSWMQFLLRSLTYSKRHARRLPKEKRRGFVANIAKVRATLLTAGGGSTT